MSDIKLGEPIAERELDYYSEKGKEILIVTLGKPRLDSDPEGGWECPIQIGEKVKLAYGIDSYQALSMALQLISIELRYLSNKQNTNLKWLGMDDLGFEPIREK